ncbi:MAG: hypothetical protein IJR86_01835 [Bacteroidaceae bacterium]|nr:hypothetical protein [Bacteroidaceae bacterium]
MLKEKPDGDIGLCVAIRHACVSSLFCVTIVTQRGLLKVLRQVALNRTDLPVRYFGINLHRGEAEDELEVVAPVKVIKNE